MTEFFVFVLSLVRRTLSSFRTGCGRGASPWNRWGESAFRHRARSPSRVLRVHGRATESQLQPVPRRARMDSASSTMPAMISATGAWA